MKNKEIEEILNYMKQYVENIYEHDSEPMLNWKDLQIVLSYIEQLEEFKKEHLIMKQILIENGLWEKLLNDDRFINYLKEDDNK